MRPQPTRPVSNVTIDAQYIFSQQDLGAPQAVELNHGQAVFYTHRAPYKEEATNEDSLALLAVDSTTTVLMIADGLGGQPSGHTASDIAVTTLAETLAGADRAGRSAREAILEGYDKANQRIRQTGTGAATTLAVVEIQRNQLRTYHTGDSMIVVTGQRGKQKLYTVSHSPVGYALEAGLLDEEEAISHEERHLVSNVVGAEDMNISVGSPIRLATYDTVLVASDGLFDNLYSEEIMEMIRKGPLLTAAHNLVEVAHNRMANPGSLQPCHPDDLSFIIYRPGQS